MSHGCENRMNNSLELNKYCEYVIKFECGEFSKILLNMYINRNSHSCQFNILSKVNLRKRKNVIFLMDCTQRELKLLTPPYIF